MFLYLIIEPCNDFTYLNELGYIVYKRISDISTSLESCGWVFKCFESQINKVNFFVC